MRFEFLLISSIIGVIGVITCIQAGAIEVIYTGDGCDCQKKLNYLVNMPIAPEPKYDIPNEYGYNLQRPLSPKSRVVYSFDFAAEEPQKTTPPPEVKWDLFAKIDRITAPKKDCIATEEAPKPCGCKRYAFANRYVSSENSAARFTRNLRHPNSIDNMPQPSAPATKIMAIFFQPLKQTKAGVTKSRNKRDISRIFMRPRRYEKRSDRLVKKYNKHLKDLAESEKTYFDDVQKPIRSRAIAAATAPPRIRPLQQLRNFLTMPNLRSKRDIKGEYDLIEKEREQMDLTLPEIIQYMPETLQPNFKRNQCQFGQSCQHPEQSESSTNSTPTKGTNETMKNMTTTESKDITKDILNVTEATNTLKDGKEEKQINNSISTVHIKRNADDYGDGGCPLVTKSNNPTPNPSYTYEAAVEPVVAAKKAYGLDPVPQQYVGSSYDPYSSAIIDNAYAKPTSQQVSHSQLDQIIASIVNKHSNFIEASSHPDGALVDSPQVQEEQAKHFLKSLAPWNDLSWSGGHYHQQYPKVHAYLTPYNTPVATYVQ